MRDPLWLSVTNAGLVLVAAACFGVGSTPAQQASSTLSAKALVPRDGTEVDVMERVFPERYIGLAKKIAAAIQQDPEWFRSAIKKAGPGNPVAYDPRLGVTKEEYDDFMKLRDNTTLQKVKPAKLHVKRDGERFEFDGGDDLPNLKGVVLDLETNTVTTPFGATTERHTIKASDAQKLTGPFDGLEWKFGEFSENPLTIIDARLILGRVVKTGRGILHYEASQVDGKSKKTVSYILQYDLPPPDPK